MFGRAKPARPNCSKCLRARISRDASGSRPSASASRAARSWRAARWLGLLVGAANGALLIQPTGWTDGDQVLGLLAVGGAIGAAGGFAYGQTT